LQYKTKKLVEDVKVEGELLTSAYCAIDEDIRSSRELKLRSFSLKNLFGEYLKNRLSMPISIQPQEETELRRNTWMRHGW
jgi:hypothetical protein